MCRLDVWVDVWVDAGKERKRDGVREEKYIQPKHIGVPCLMSNIPVLFDAYRCGEAASNVVWSVDRLAPRGGGCCGGCHGDGDRGARTRQVPGLCLLCLAGSMLLE